MFKRPILLATMVFTMVLCLICHLDPSVFYPKIPLRPYEVFHMEGTVLSLESHGAKDYVFLSRVRTSHADYDKAVLVLSEEETHEMELKAGNRVSSACIYQPFQTAANFGNFDEKAYYASMGIFIRAKSRETKVTDRKVLVLRQFLSDVRRRLVSSIRAAVPDEDTAAILAAICTGDRSALSEETRDLYQRSGVIHILAVSGLHISILGLSVFRLLRRRLPYLPAAGISTALMLGFCLMSESSPSAVRATIMFLVQLGAIGLGKTSDILSSLSFAVLIMLLYRPSLILSSGFIMSVTAILGVGIIYRSLCVWFLLPAGEGYQMKDGRMECTGKEGIQPWIKKGRTAMGRNFLMSLSVTLAMLPVTASVYYEIPLYAVLLNLLVVPLMSVVLSVGMICAVTGMIRLVLGRFFAGLGVYLVWFTRWCCMLTDQLPLHSVVTGCPEAWRLGLYYGVMLAFMGMIKMRRFSLRKRIFAVFLGTAVLMVILMAGKGPSALRISFLDVGQGDSILLETPSGTVYLIDGGSSSQEQVGKYRMEDAIRYYGIDHIDYVFITHPDMDHISGILEILGAMRNGKEPEGSGLVIRRILIPDVAGNENYEILQEMAGRKGVPVISLHAGMQLTDDDLAVTCLHPGIGYNSESTNGFSAVLDVEYGAFSALFTGDLEADGEALLLRGEQLRRSGYDLLKAAHHGSRFSSTEAFVLAARPRIAVISAGEDNPYGHPHAETLERLQEVGAKIYVTAERGEIIVEADKTGTMTIRTRK